MVHLGDLVNERGDARAERGWIVVDDDVEVNAMLPTREERLAVVPTGSRGERISAAHRGNKREESAHASRSALTTSITSGRGLIVSRLPRGICSTRLIALGTATTIRDPRSTLRRSHSTGRSFTVSPSHAKTPGRDAIGANTASCVLVVKMMKAGASVNDVVFADSMRVSSNERDAYNLPDLARPMNIASSSSPDTATL